MAVVAVGFAGPALRAEDLVGGFPFLVNFDVWQLSGLLVDFECLFRAPLLWQRGSSECEAAARLSPGEGRQDIDDIFRDQAQPKVPDSNLVTKEAAKYRTNTF